jgi:hypothetical protein
MMQAGDFSMNTRASQKPSLTAVRGLSLAAALPVVAIGLAGCGGGGSSSTSSDAGAGTQSGPAIVAAGKGGSGSARAKSGASSRTRPTPAHASTSAKAPAGSTTPTTTSGPKTIHRAASTPGEEALRRFAGSGNTRLGTIVVRSPQVLEWRTARGPIQIFAANGFMLVNSSSPSGSIHLSRGTYRSVRVATHANWSIELRSRA